MGKFGEELIESVQQAAAHAGGRKVSGVRVTTVKIPDAKAIPSGQFFEKPQNHNQLGGAS